jgi:hypothetical protein
MKKEFIRSALVLSIAIVLGGSASFPVQKSAFSLKEDLIIGAESGDENLVFSGLGAIDLDAEGNIYVFDWSNRRIQRFDSQGKFLNSIVGKQGQGPEEVAVLGGVAVSPGGTIAVLDRGGNKVVLFNNQGAFIRMFKLAFSALYLGFPQRDRIVVLGLSEQQIFHFFDAEGRALASFGEPFAVPPHLSRFKDIPQMRLPLRFSCSRDGTIFVANPHKFEISVYKNAGLTKKIGGKSDLFEPVRVPQSSPERVAMVFPFLTVVEFGERLYVTVMRPATQGEGPNELIIYEKDQRAGSLPIVGMPRTVDDRGRLYCSVDTPFPRLIRYEVTGK